MNIFNNTYPFSAIVGQHDLKLVLLLNAINPRIGGVLIRGEKGTAKSTTVRALAALLPEIKVIKGCPYSCDPNNLSGMCNRCQSSLLNHTAGHTTESRRVRVVTLPLNVTEDRVVGGIDFNFAIRHGKRELQPGLLAETHRGILYIDEVNLLDDHIVDIILDASSSGKNVVEREGISFSHHSDFILVGTMNLEEGELRPQLLDRFGLCVEVKGETDPVERILLMERRERFDSDPSAFIKHFEDENKIVANSIIQAKKILDGIRFPKYLRSFISELCTENNVVGHRADIILEQSAKTFAALEKRTDVTTDDIQKVAFFVLAHRKRDSAPPPQPEEKDQEKDQNQKEQNQEDQEQNNQDQENSREPKTSGDFIDEKNSPENNDPAELDPEIKDDQKNHPAPEQIFEVGKTFKVKNFSAPKDRTFRRGSGKRSRTRIFQKQGRYIKSTTQNISGDIALDATLRAAAPFQKQRGCVNGLAVSLTRDDIREKIREKRIGNLLLFLVDASGSMGAKGRMAASKGAVMSLLLDAYQKRDKVAMVSFRKDEAVVNLPPTSSVELAGNLLKDMPVGGRTPFSAGILRGYELLQNYLLKEPSGRPIIIIISDGKANKSVGEKKPVEEALSFAAKMASDERIRFIVVDTEEKGLVIFGLAKRFAEVTNAKYFKIDDLKADQLVNIIKEKI